jgi:hypothetical protein
MIWRQPRSRIEVEMAILSLSVPPLVKNISPGFAFKILATVFLAFSIASLDSLP